MTPAHSARAIPSRASSNRMTRTASEPWSRPKGMRSRSRKSRRQEKCPPSAKGRGARPPRSCPTPHRNWMRLPTAQPTPMMMIPGRRQRGVGVSRLRRSASVRIRDGMRTATIGPEDAAPAARKADAPKDDRGHAPAGYMAREQACRSRCSRSGSSPASAAKKPVRTYAPDLRPADLDTPLRKATGWLLPRRRSTTRA